LQNSCTFNKGKSSQKSKYPLGAVVSCHSDWISRGFRKDAGVVTSQPDNFLLFFDSKTLELLFESQLPQPYEFPRLYFPMICPRLFHDTNFYFKSALNLCYTAKVSALLFKFKIQTLGLCK